jgi:hypothetical protein
MASSYSTGLSLELMVTGEKSGLWGDITNTNLQLIQQGILGYTGVTLNATTGATLVVSDGALSNGRNHNINLSGTLTSSVNVTIPDGMASKIIKNATTGAFEVTFKTAGGTGTTFSTTDKGHKIVYSDGNNVVDVLASLSQINLVNRNEARFEDATGGQYVGLRAPATVASSVTFNLPSADGSASGQYLQTDASGTLSFSTFVPASTGKAIAMALVFG